MSQIATVGSRLQSTCESSAQSKFKVSPGMLHLHSFTEIVITKDSKKSYVYLPVILMDRCLKGILSESLLYFGYITKEAVISAHTGFSPWFGNSAVCWAIIPDMRNQHVPL
jgi:hypothetical protein